MNKLLKLIPSGNSTGAVFPKELLQELGVRQGDTLLMTRTPERIEIRAGDPSSKLRWRSCATTCAAAEAK
jgi:antitoxin component of MazEF toxin-antitoxin module